MPAREDTCKQNPVRHAYVPFKARRLLQKINTAVNTALVPPKHCLLSKADSAVNTASAFTIHSNRERRATRGN
ncbi:hypothetical protein NDU88_003562 [Pleurodeles waltl]|uniref:Uncharacterized protein n=1 Tax=Pleurodeles waltl TaxID=8319 RepID=A0AAV7T5U3_PLEWA|nr:hypothetical protein NDU88_003562 [Pleurodeles waltl]